MNKRNFLEFQVIWWCLNRNIDTVQLRKQDWLKMFYKTQFLETVKTIPQAKTLIEIPIQSQTHLSEIQPSVGAVVGWKDTEI